MTTGYTGNDGLWHADDCAGYSCDGCGYIGVDGGWYAGQRPNSSKGSGYCTAECGEMSDEFGPDALCAYHRDHQEDGTAE